MDTLYFDGFEDLACAIADKFDELDKENFEDITVIAKYEEVKEVFKELIYVGYDICSITLDIPDKYGYNDEYILGLSNEGLWIEKFKRDNGYLNDDSTVTYILDNCSSKVIMHCIGEGMIFEVHVDDYDDEFDGDLCIDCVDEDCPMKCTTGCKDNEKDDKTEKEEHVECSKDEDGDLHGFTASKSDGNSYYSCSVYTSDRLSLKDIQSLLQEVGF